MKKIAVTTLAAAPAGTVGLALAPLASADPAPALAPGAYTWTGSNGKGRPADVAQDCGPSCFSVSLSGDRREFHLVGDRWQTDSGIWTVDCVHLSGSTGKAATLTPA